jgi:Uma2 family endonuclease
MNLSIYPMYIQRALFRQGEILEMHLRKPHSKRPHMIIEQIVQVLEAEGYSACYCEPAVATVTNYLI